MRLIVFDRPTDKRINFYPLALSRPIFELRCGMTSLLEKLIAKFAAHDVACFVPPYLADVYRAQSNRTVNDVQSLRGDDLLLIDGRAKAADLQIAAVGPSQVGLDAASDVLYARIAKADLDKLKIDSLEELFESAKAILAHAAEPVVAWNYTWDLVLANPAQLAADFQVAGRSGIEGVIEEPRAIRGNANDVYVAPSAKVHPMVVIDAEHGPVYLDEGVEVHPFTRIEGPCYVGKNSILLGCKCREGNSIGPMCRLGGEVEESIIHGYSNKYHDGFLGHAYVGQWVNLGAMTTNSDLKNDYSSVSVVLDGKRPVNTGSTKVGSLIGDHTKTSIGTLLNTGAYLGAMSLIATHGKLLPKFMPCFSWFVEGAVTKGFGKKKVYETARVAMSRRKCQWTEAEERMWDEIYNLTAPEREEAIKRGRNIICPGKNV
jgi:UDP-N-acetylglucosamine diphosphorylase / glucose-1-phosphate thymidylyltransferase / UDP-N-acetylgalactosamine diphosphorylase / glucosamine-1-phosphate N-acetyltransferase / galactosamine-1-phosphate N-acetyltransferase